MKNSKKYFYRLPISVDLADGWLLKSKDGTIKVSTASPGFVNKTPTFHFTDEEVEQYTGKGRQFFDLCEKEEVNHVYPARR